MSNKLSGKKIEKIKELIPTSLSNREIASISSCSKYSIRKYKKKSKFGPL